MAWRMIPCYSYHREWEGMCIKPYKNLITPWLISLITVSARVRGADDKSQSPQISSHVSPLLYSLILSWLNGCHAYCPYQDNYQKLSTEASVEACLWHKGAGENDTAAA